MTSENRMTTKRRAMRAGRAALVAVILAAMTGCHSSSGTTTSTPRPAESPAQVRANSVASVQANPHIPPQVKASIIAQLQGKSHQVLGLAHH